MISFKIKVAGIVVQISSEVEGLIIRFREMYLQYEIVTHSEEVYAQLTIVSQDLSRYVNMKEMELSLGNENIVTTQYFYFACFNIENRQATLITNLDNIYSFSEEYLLKWFSYLCLSQGKLLFHCAVAVDNYNNAFVFYGPSGIGKSTVAKNSIDHKIITDDLAIFEPLTNNIFKIYKTPFERNKKMTSSLEYNVKGFFRLHQDTVIRLEALTTISHISNVMGNIWNIDFNKDGYLMYLDLLHNYFSQIPGYSLYLKDNSDFWKELQQT
jgi:hypothetical protein